MHHARVIAALIAASSLSMVIACSGGSSTPEDGTSTDPTKPAEGKPATGNGGAPVPSGPAGSSSAGASSSGGGTSGGGASSSGGGATADAGADSAAAACFQKCATSNPQGVQQFAAILSPCACATNVCGSVCTACAAPGGASAQDLLGSASAACRACVQGSLANGAVCNNAEKQKCPRQSQCPAFALCAQGCL